MNINELELSERTPRSQHFSKVRHANFTSKKFRDNRDPQGQYEEYVRESNLMTTGQLVWLATDRVLIEAHWEHNRR